jgi:pSer/pThr/pTyr-binding forkhead associated (FHA) protein
MPGGIVEHFAIPCLRVDSMPPQLVALTEGPNIPLNKPIVLLGRHQECDIQLGSRKVSRRHCCMAQVNDYLVVRDLGSTNGIRINGTRVIEGVLRPGDELTIGNQRYQVMWVETPPLVLHGPPGAAPPIKVDPRVESSEIPVMIPETASPLVAAPAGMPPVLNGVPPPVHAQIQPGGEKHGPEH